MPYLWSWVTNQNPLLIDCTVLCSYPVMIQLVLTMTSCGGGECSVQQTNHPELCWRSESPNPRVEGLVCEDTCVNMCVVILFLFLLYFIGYALLYLSPNVNRGDDCISFLLIAFDVKLAALHLRFCVWCSGSASPRGQKAQCYCI